MVPLRPEELFLSGHAEELPDLPVRRTDRHQRPPRGAAGRRQHLARGDRAGTHGRRHRQADPPGQRDRSNRRRHHVADRLQPRRGPADRDRHQARRRRGGAGPGDCPGVRDRTARSVAGLGSFRCPDGSGLDAVRFERLAQTDRAGRVRHPHRNQERQLAQECRSRRALRNAQAGSGSGIRRNDPAGDPTLPRGRLHLARSQQGDRAGLPVLPRTRPGAGGPQRRARRTAACHHPRASMVVAQTDSAGLGCVRRGDARPGQHRRARSDRRDGRPRRVQ